MQEQEIHTLIGYRTRKLFGELLRLASNETLLELPLPNKGFGTQLTDNTVDLSSGTTGIDNCQTNNLVHDGGSRSPGFHGRAFGSKGSERHGLETRSRAFGCGGPHQSVASQTQCHIV